MLFNIGEALVNVLKNKIEDQLQKPESLEKLKESYRECVKVASKGSSEDEINIYIQSFVAVIESVMEDIDISDVDWTVEEGGKVYSIAGRMDGDIFVGMEFNGKLYHTIFSLDVVKAPGMDIIQYSIDGDSGIFGTNIGVIKDTFGISVNYLEEWGYEEDDDDMDDWDDDDWDDEDDDDEDVFRPTLLV